MAAAIALREDFSAEDLRALAREIRDSRQCRRLLALAAVADGRSRAEAAEIGGMDRQTLHDWVHRFNGEGPEGPLDRKTAGPAPKLTGALAAFLLDDDVADVDANAVGDAPIFRHPGVALRGAFPVDTVMKITAMMSWTIRMPMATLPCRDSISPFSSNAFTAKTVLEKLRAKATKA